MSISEENKNNIMKIIQEYIGTGVELSLETDIVNDLGLSSFDAVMICSTIEEQLGITVDISRLYNSGTIGDLLEGIGK